MLRIGDTKNELTVIGINGDRVTCKCSCGRIKEYSYKRIAYENIKSCGHLNHSNNDLIGKTFKDIEVIESTGRGRYKCRCKCGAEKIMVGGDIRKGRGITCTHYKENIQYSMIGKQFGELLVTSIKGDLCICKCSCGNIINIYGSQLREGKRKSCGCLKNRKAIGRIGETFGYLTVIDFKDGLYICKCVCGNIVSIKSGNLLNNSTMSCGCKKHELMQSAKDRQYNKARTKDQTNALKSREEMIKFIESSFGAEKPTTLMLCEALGITRGAVEVYINKFDIKDYLTSGAFHSIQEEEIYNFIRSIYNGEIQRNNRSILDNQELDLYMPELKIAIEFNGNYWHSDLVKDTYYHQNKTLNCFKHRIRLIHIFEYEWTNQKDQIKHLLMSSIQSSNIVYARNTIIRHIDNSEYSEFIKNNHLQGYAPAEIKLGCYFNNKLLGVMSFGSPRFDHDYQYELIRLAWDYNTKVIGGTEKLFNTFTNEFKPQSILSYCNISKFTGNVYTRLGFNTNIKLLTKPNYVWVDEHNNVVDRYKSQKQNLIKNGLGKKEQTEDEIMRSLGYFRVYDSGNLKFEWRNTDE